MAHTLVLDDLKFSVAFSQTRMMIDGYLENRNIIIACNKKYNLEYYGIVHDCASNAFIKQGDLLENLTSLLPSATIKFKDSSKNVIHITLSQTNDGSVTYRHFDLVCKNINASLVMELFNKQSNSKVVMLETSIEHLEIRCRELEDELARVKLHNKFFVSDANKIDANKIDACENCEVVNKQLHEKITELKQLKYDFVKINESRRGFKTAYEEVENTINALSDENSRYKSENEALQCSVEKLTVENNKLTELIQTISNSDEVADTVTKITVQLDNITVKVASLEKHNNRLELQNEKLIEQINECLQQNVDQKKSKDDNQLEQEITRLRKHNSFLAEENEALNLMLRNKD